MKLTAVRPADEPFMSDIGGLLPSRCGGGLCCTTQRRNAHGTIQRELLYPWHPWAGRLVHIHEVIDKHGAGVFRSAVSGQASDRWLEGKREAHPIWRDLR